MKVIYYFNGRTDEFIVIGLNIYCDIPKLIVCYNHKVIKLIKNLSEFFSMTNKTILMTSIITMTLIFTVSQTMTPAEAATGDTLQDHPGACFGIAFDGTTLWCSGLGTTTITTIDATTGIPSPGRQCGRSTICEI